MPNTDDKGFEEVEYPPEEQAIVRDDNFAPVTSIDAGPGTTICPDGVSSVYVFQLNDSGPVYALTGMAAVDMLEAFLQRARQHFS